MFRLYLLLTLLIIIDKSFFSLLRIGRYLTPPQRNHAIDVAEPEGEYKQDDTKKKFPEDKKFGYF